MSTRKHPSKFRAIRPSAEGLEDRKLLSGSITGVDGDGDTWTLRLSGPGALRVVRQNGPDGAPVPLSEPGQIQSITIAGAQNLQSRLVGAVRRGPNGDGKVFFQQLEQLGSLSHITSDGNTVLAVNLPNFWLGLTDSAGVTTTTEPSISFPDGVNTLRFGGVDTTAFFGQDPNLALNRNGQNDALQINLGLPQTGGTRIIVDQVITDAQAGVTTGGTTGQTTQDSAIFTVLGRINIFQANEIRGNTQLPSSDFGVAGGTVVQSLPDQGAAITGQIGDLRIGGNATNLSVLTNDRISNFFIGGETNNVSLLAPNGSRNLNFGKGLDTTTILTHTIQSLRANRGALNSTVISDRQIGNVVIGGDMVNTLIESGYRQSLDQVLQNPSNPPLASAQNFGSISIRVAGDVTDSVIAASTEPFDGQFGSAQDLRLPGGRINGKIEGTIDNANATPESPNTAFYAKEIGVYRGPVIPPNVPEAPYPKPTQPTRLPGIPNINSGNKAILPRVSAARVVPKGPKTS